MTSSQSSVSKSSVQVYKKAEHIRITATITSFFSCSIQLISSRGSFKYPYDFILDHFLSKKVGKLIESQKKIYIDLIIHCSSGFNCSFFDLINELIEIFVALFLIIEEFI